MAIDRIPWPVSPTQRLWLYGAVEASLLAEATRRAVAGDAIAMLTGGCDHTLRATNAWAAERGIDLMSLLGALAARGATCDCELLLRAGDGGELDLVVITGHVVGISALYDVALVVEREPAPPEPGELIWIARDAEGAAVPAQAVIGALIARLCDVLATGGTNATLALGYPQAGGTIDLVSAGGGAVAIESVDPGGAPAWAALLIEPMQRFAPRAD